MESPCLNCSPHSWVNPGLNLVLITGWKHQYFPDFIGTVPKIVEVCTPLVTPLRGLLTFTVSPLLEISKVSGLFTVLQRKQLFASMSSFAPSGILYSWISFICESSFFTVPMG